MKERKCEMDWIGLKKREGELRPSVVAVKLDDDENGNFGDSTMKVLSLELWAKIKKR